MAKWVCSVCGYVYEGEAAPAVCPVCKAPAEKFIKQDGTMSWAAEHCWRCQSCSGRYHRGSSCKLPGRVL